MSVAGAVEPCPEATVGVDMDIPGTPAAGTGPVVGTLRKSRSVQFSVCVCVCVCVCLCVCVVYDSHRFHCCQSLYPQVSVFPHFYF